ncbi:MAG: hypothetical protein E7213_02295 [Clostridium sp.]|nr:hypothetical protein [Clostridium sp.]
MITKIKELGLSLISVLLFQIALSIVSIQTSINFLKLKNFTNSLEISSSQLISEIVICIALILSIILFIFKRKLGITLYICSILISLLCSIFFTTLDFQNLLISLILPALTLALIYIKRNTILY